MSTKNPAARAKTGWKTKCKPTQNMTRPKITPGTWNVTGEFDTLRVVTNSDAPESCDGIEQIARVVCGDYEFTHYERPACNARAIAALPELLDALEAMLAEFGNSGRDLDPELSADRPRILARRALTKAGYTF